MNINELSIFYATRALRLLKKSGFKVFLQRGIILSGPIRNLLVVYHRRKSKRNPSISSAETQFNHIQPKRILSNLNQFGFSEGIQLNQNMIDAILNFAQNNPVDNVTKPNTVINSLMEEAPISGIRTYMFVNPHKQFETIREIGYDKNIVNIVSEYLGVANPILFSTRLYWSFPNQLDAKTNAYPKPYFHFDVSDSKAITLFFYLTDVDDHAGPHVVIKGTNTNRTLFNLLNWKLGKDKAAKKYNDKIWRIVGPRGTGFFEDLLNYHKHAFTTRKYPRLMLAFTYVIQRKT